MIQFLLTFIKSLSENIKKDGFIASFPVLRFLVPPKKRLDKKD